MTECIVCVKELGIIEGKIVLEGPAPKYTASVMFEGNSYCTKHYLELLEWRKQNNPGHDIFPFEMFGDLVKEKK